MDSLDDATDEEEDTRTNDEILDDFSSEWLVEIDKDDQRSLAVFLSNVFTKHNGMLLTEAAQLAAVVVGKGERSVRQWRTNVIKNKGKLPQRALQKERSVVGE